jgi:homoserine kinase
MLTITTSRYIIKTDNKTRITFSMLKTRAEAFAPASVANLGVGFDILGLALRELGDRVIAEHRDEPGVIITRIEGDGGKLPLDPAKNTAAVAAHTVLKTIGAKTGVALTIIKGLPLASGLGSSAASAVAGAVAVNALFGEPLAREALLPACLDGEALVSGYHADNVAPSLLGGITLIGGTNADQIQKLPIPANLFLALVTPDVAVPTAQARAVLPKMVSLYAMISQTAKVAQLIDALHRGDLRPAAAAMEGDCIIEPARAHLMPHLTELRTAAKANGAFGLVISGAGPTLCAVCDSREVAERVSNLMRETYTAYGLASISLSTQVSADGAKIFSVE